MIPDRVVSEMKAIAITRYPHEAVFAYWSEDDWRELTNTHGQPRGAFTVGSDDLKACLDRPPRVLVHSHTTGTASPSDIDTLNQLRCGYPWGIISLEGDDAGQVWSAKGPEYFGVGAPMAPLIGRSYLWGVRDCFTLVQAYFTAQGKTVACVPRVDGGNNRFNDWIPKLGFKSIEGHQLEPGDVVVMQLSHTFPDHCAVYLGEGQFLEHIAKRLSGIQFHRRDVLERWNANYYRLKDSNAQDRSSWSIDRPLPCPA